MGLACHAEGLPTAWTTLRVAHIWKPPPVASQGAGGGFQMLRAVDKRAERSAPPIFIFALQARLQPEGANQMRIDFALVAAPTTELTISLRSTATCLSNSDSMSGL